jgi:hypothetical protein
MAASTKPERHRRDLVCFRKLIAISLGIELKVRPAAILPTHHGIGVLSQIEIRSGAEKSYARRTLLSEVKNF